MLSKNKKVVLNNYRKYVSIHTYKAIKYKNTLTRMKERRSKATGIQNGTQSMNVPYTSCTKRY